MKKNALVIGVIVLAAIVGYSAGNPFFLSNMADRWQAWREESAVAKAEKALQKCQLLALELENESQAVDNYEVLILQDSSGWGQHKALSLFQQRARTLNVRVVEYANQRDKLLDHCPDLPSPKKFFRPEVPSSKVKK